MQFGRLDDVSGIDLSLPPDDKATAKLLKALPKREGEPKVYVGCPVWADKGYIGKIYPKGAKPDKFLYWYCRQFNSIEVNATAYNMPTAEQILKWKEVATPGFKYCPKLPQFITHRREIDKKDDAIDRYIRTMYELGDHLGPTLMQLPPHFSPKRLDELYRFLESLPQDLEMAVEVRHPDWFNNDNAKNDLLDMLAGLGKTAVITDVAGRRDVLHMRLTSGTAFIRFNGHNVAPIDLARMDEWMPRIDDWIKKGLHTIYFFMHEPDKAMSAIACDYLIKHLVGIKGVSLKPSTPPEQLLDGTDTLF